MNPTILGATNGVGGEISNVEICVVPGSNLPNPDANILVPILLTV